MARLILSLLILLLVSHGNAWCESDSAPLYAFQLNTVHSGPCWRVEIPVDLDMDGEDEILLWSDQRRGGHEITFIQLHDSDDNFIVGPYLPGGGIQSIADFDLDHDGLREIVICVEDPLTLHVVSSQLDTLEIHQLSEFDRQQGTTATIEGAVDANGTGPLEVLLALTTKRAPFFTRLVTVDWISGEVCWNVDLPGILHAPILRCVHEGVTCLVAPFAGHAGAGFSIIGADGKVLRQVVLEPEGPVEMSASLLDDPLRDPALITLTTPSGPADTPAILTIWYGMGTGVLHRAEIPEASKPVMLCEYEGESRIVLSTKQGEVLLLDHELAERGRYRVARGSITLAMIEDMDLNGCPDIVCRTNDGQTVCLHLPEGQVVRVAGSDEIHVVRNGFGMPPTLVVRQGTLYNYLELGHGDPAPVGGVVLTPAMAGALSVGVLVIGILLGGAAVRLWRLRETQRVLRFATLPVCLITRKRENLWANERMLSFLGCDRLTKPRGSFDELLREAGFSMKLTNDPAEGPAQSVSPDFSPAFVVKLWKGSRHFSLDTVRSCQDAMGRHVQLVSMEEVTERLVTDVHDAWASAARELTAEMRNALSTIRLAAQWLLKHSADASDGSSLHTRLDRILKGSRSLRELADRLADAAALVDGKKEPLDVTTVLKESIRSLPRDLASRIRLARSPHLPEFMGNRRQLVFALDMLYAPLLASGHGVLDIGASHEQRGDGEAVVFEMSYSSAGHPKDESPVLPRYAVALAGAVACSHGGDLSLEGGDQGSLTVRIAFPATRSA